MDLTNFSLLYPDAESKQEFYSADKRPDIDEYTLGELGMLEILDLKSGELSDYFTLSPEVMKYRNEVFADMLNCPVLTETLNKLMPVLNDVTELRRLEADSGRDDDYLSSITEIELYISCIEILYDGLSRARNDINSRAFKLLEERIRFLAESDYYKELNKTHLLG